MTLWDIQRQKWRNLKQLILFDMEKLDWKKVGKWFLGFAIARIIFDSFSKETIDFVGVIAIPLIAIGLMYLVDKKQLLKDE